jgi:hypothetical protein
MNTYKDIYSYAEVAAGTEKINQYPQDHKCIGFCGKCGLATSSNPR